MARSLTEGNNTLYCMYNKKKGNMTPIEREECIRGITLLHQLDGLIDDPDAKQYVEQIESYRHDVRKRVASILLGNWI